MSDVPLWDRLKEESAPAYEAFQAYLELGSDRSCAKVGQKLGKSTTLCERWSAQWDWVERARAYDDSIAKDFIAARKKKHTEEVDEYRRKHLETAETLYSIAQDFLIVVKRRLAKVDEVEDSVFSQSVGNESDQLTVDQLKRLARNYDLKTIALTYGIAVKGIQTALESNGRGLGIEDILEKLKKEQESDSDGKRE